MNDQRITDVPRWDAALIMGLVYTAIYGLMLGSIMLVPIPDANKATIDILAGQMTIIQTGIVAYFFGRTKSSDDAQKANAQNRERTDSVLREVVQKGANGDTHKPIKADDVTVKASGDVTVEQKP